MKVEDVDKAVAKVCGVQVSDLRVRCKRREFIDAKHIAWKILKDGGYGITELGHAYERNHGAVAKGIKRITGLIEVHRKIEARYNEVLEELCC